MFERIREYAESKDYSEGFFSKKMKVRIVLMVVAIAFLFIAKAYDERQAEKQAALDAALQNAAAINKDEAGIAVGPAPDFKLKDFNEQDDALSAHFGRPLVLSFWATWSNESQQTLPALDDAYDKYGDEVEFMLVDLTDGKKDTVSDVKKFLSAADYGFPVYFDLEHYGELAYNVLSIPMTVFIDSSGNVVNCVLSVMGAEELDARIEALLE